MVFATSDWHGCPLETVQALFAKAGVTARDDVYVLGDVIDRGEHGVLLLRWIMAQPNVTLLLGNHEAMLLACRFLFHDLTADAVDALSLLELRQYVNWLSNGAKPTLDALRRLPREARADILDYLDDAPLYEALEVGGKNYVLTHSGLGNFSPEKKLRDYTPDELLWTRPDPEDRYFTQAHTVFGHTPTLVYGARFAGKIFRTETWTDIDAGAAGGRAPLMLRLDDGAPTYLDA